MRRVVVAAAISAACLQEEALAGRLGDEDEAVHKRTGYKMSASMNHSSMNMLYYNTKLMDRVRLKIKEVMFKDDKLELPDEMIKSLDFGKGEKCKLWSDYTTDDMGDKEWQCANTNWIYDPPASIRDKLEHFVGELTDAETKPELQTAGSGLWCGMNMESDQDSENARIYWANCGSPGGGYFNALRCKDKTVYAVIGVRAANPGICYPAHASEAEEASWQVAGQATWRTFGDHGGSRNEEDTHGDHAPHYYPHGTVHELETDDDNEFEGMLSLYFWGMQSTSGLQAVQHHRRAELEGQSCWFRYCQECGVPRGGWPSCPARGGYGGKGRGNRFKRRGYHGRGYDGPGARLDRGFDGDYDYYDGPGRIKVVQAAAPAVHVVGAPVAPAAVVPVR